MLCETDPIVWRTNGLDYEADNAPFIMLRRGFAPCGVDPIFSLYVCNDNGDTMGDPWRVGTFQECVARAEELRAGALRKE